jgi:hypothetical protein
MEARQQKVLARFGQVLTFLDANTSLIDPSAVASQRQVLNSAITQINGFAQDQVKKGTETVLAQSLSSARTALRDTFMRQLATVGLHSLTGKNAGDPNVANAKQVFTLPATRTNALTLIASAQAMVQMATPFAALFTTNGVDLNAVTGAIQALQNAVTADASALRVSKGATQGIKAQLQAGHGAVRLMDVVIRPLLAGNKAVLSQWDSVKRAAGGSALPSPVPVPAAVPSGTSTPAPASPVASAAGSSAASSTASAAPATPAAPAAPTTTATSAAA